MKHEFDNWFFAPLVEAEKEAELFECYAETADEEPTQAGFAAWKREREEREQESRMCRWEE
jgi:hypothetical protein